MSSLVCPSPAVIRQLACGRVPAERERELDRHLARCGPCRAAHDDYFRPLLVAVRELSTSRSGDYAHLRYAGAVGLLPPGANKTVVRVGPPPGTGDADLTAPGRNEADVPVTDPDLGTLGKFRLLAILGEGGMGRVYRALDTSLGREVALKVILLRAGRREATVEQRHGLFSEAQAAAKLNDPNIVPVYEVGEIDDTPYLVMPLLSGGTLAARLKRGPLSLYELCRIGEQIARGLAAAHGAKLVHRDIKPANVWLEPRPGGAAVRILDFGLARPLTEVTAGLAGTPAYMAPEQAAGKPVDARADLFSLGVVLFEMATGKRLFPGDGASVTDVLESVKEFHAPPGAKLLPNAPPRLASLIARLLRNDPARREPTDAEELADTLTALASEFDPSRRRRRLLRFAQMAALLVVGGGMVWGGLGLYRHMFKAPVDLERTHRPPPNESDGRTVTPEAVIPAAVKADRLENLNHLSRSQIAPEALTAAGDGNRDRVAKEVVAALTHPGFVEAVALHPKGKILASAGNDRTVRLWDLAESPPKELTVLRNHTATVGRLAFTASGTYLVSGAVDGTVIAWRLPTEGSASVVQQFKTADPVTAIGVSPISNLVALGCADGSVRVFDVETGAGREVVRGNRPSGVNSAMFTDNDQKLIVGSNGLLRQIDLADGNKELWNLAESKVRFAALAASPDRNRFVANGYGYAAGERPGALLPVFAGFGNNQDLERQYSLSVRALTGEPVTQKKLRHDGQVVRAAWTPDGQQIVTLTDDSQLYVWNWEGEIMFGQPVKLAHEKVEHHVLCRDLVLHPDGRHAIVCRTNGQILIVRFKQK